MSDRSPAVDEPRSLAAAIDLGTNTALCLIGRLDARGGLEVLQDRSEMVRLGERLAQRGTLLPAAIDRTLDVLADFVRDMDERGVPAERRRAVSTAVLRRATDAEAFVARARERCGLSIEILSPEEEARLGHAAVAGRSGPDTVVVDVGGGSTEVAWKGGRQRASVPVGAVVLTDLHGEDIEAAAAAAREACLALPEGIAREPGSTVVGIGGTAVNLACLDQELDRFDANLADGRSVETERVRAWARELARIPPQERRGLPIETGREGILQAGLTCLGAALERIGAPRIRVSQRGLRYGILAEMLSGGL